MIRQLSDIVRALNRRHCVKEWLVTNTSRCRVNRCYSTSNDTTDEDVISLSYGPKDTLLMLGYKVKHEDLNSHINTLNEALKIKLMTLNYYSGDVAQSYCDIAMAQHQSLEHLNASKDNYLKAYEIWMKVKGPESREVANVLCLIGVVLRDLGDVEAAKSALLESLKIDKKINSEVSTLCSVYSLNNLANISHLQGDYKEACNYYEDALKILLTATRGDEHHRLISLLYYNLACGYYNLPDYYNTQIALLRAKHIILKIGDHCNILHKIEEMLRLIG